jgi:hypothetical protein
MLRMCPVNSPLFPFSFQIVLLLALARPVPWHVARRQSSLLNLDLRPILTNHALNTSILVNEI